MSSTDHIYLEQEEPVKGCLLALRSIILKTDPNITESLKYGGPCFSYYNKMFCYLWMDKKTEEPYILFVEGKMLNHLKLEVGNRKRMAIYRVDPNADIQIDEVNYLLNSALELYRNGTIKIKK